MQAALGTRTKRHLPMFIIKWIGLPQRYARHGATQSKWVSLRQPQTQQANQSRRFLPGQYRLYSGPCVLAAHL